MLKAAFFNTDFSQARLSTKIGICSLHVFTGSVWVSTALANMALALMLGAFLADFRDLKKAGNDPLIKGSFCFLGYLLIDCLWSAFQGGPSLYAHLRESKDLILTGWLFIPLFAYWIARADFPLPALFSLSLVSFVVRICFLLSVPEAAQFYENILAYRFDCAMPVNAFGLYCAMHCLGLIALAPRFWARQIDGRRLFCRITLWVLLLIFHFQGMVFSQSRSALVVLVLVLPLIAAWRIRAQWRSISRPRRRQVLLATGFSILLLTGLIALNRQILAQRLLQKGDSFDQIVAGQMSNLSHPALSISLRVFLWRLGWEKWLERPLLGWGPAGVRHLLSQIDDPDLLAMHPKGVRDFHNTYLEILMQTGLIGLAFFVWFGIQLFRALRQSYRRREIPLDIFTLIVGLWVLFLLNTTANLRTGDHFGHFFAYLLGGMAYAHSMTMPARQQITTKR